MCCPLKDICEVCVQDLSQESQEIREVGVICFIHADCSSFVAITYSNDLAPHDLQNHRVRNTKRTHRTNQVAKCLETQTFVTTSLRNEEFTEFMYLMPRK